MSDQHTFVTALGEMPQEEQQEILIDLLRQQPPVVLETVLQRLPLRDLTNSGKARLCNRMAITPVGRAYRTSDGALVWELPLVPAPLRPLVTSLSRLIEEFHASVNSMLNGRGDYSRAFELMNPAVMEELTNRLRAELIQYTGELRQASGRVRRERPARPAPVQPDAEPAPETLEASAPIPAPEPEEEKPQAKRSRAKGRGKPDSEAEAGPEPTSGSVPEMETEPASGSPQEPEVSGMEAPAESPSLQGTDPAVDSNETAGPALDSFGFDVASLNAAAPVEDVPSAPERGVED